MAQIFQYLNLLSGTRSVGSSVYKVGAYGERTNLFDSRVRGAAGETLAGGGVLS